MLFALRKIRKEMIKKNKLTVYLTYAFGEIILVVVGILLAIQIDDWNRKRELDQAELESYELIITDLKRDSLLFSRYSQLFGNYLDTYFQLNRIKREEGSFKNILPDFLVSNVEFNPVTKNNHQATIDKLRNSAIREQINNYFVKINQVQQATEEFNEFISRESRPYFLKEYEIFNNSTVFDYDDRTFPPFKRVSTVDTVKLSRVMEHPQFVPILSQLRMSIGFYLASLDRSIADNHLLIQNLEKKLK